MSEVARRSHWWRRTILSFVSGALSVILLLVVAYFGIRKFDAGGRLPKRQARTEAELATRFAADMKDAADENRADIAHQVQALYARQQRDPNATLDFLLLSGGGDHGAFGAGFLLGWASVEGGNALPKFDGVSGVSAGALIAPFAFLGTQADLETIDRLFRNPKPDWVVRRGMFFFLPENASFADVPGLVRDLRSEVDLKMAERIARAGSDGRRVLLIQATDVDMGTARAFDAVAASEAHDRIQAALMALTPEYREVVVLRHFADLSYEEISEAIGVPDKTVKSRLFSARKRLAELLGTREGLEK